MTTFAAISGCFALLLTACVHPPSTYRYPSAQGFATGATPFDRFPRLLARHAPRAEVEREMVDYDGKPVRVTRRAQLLQATRQVPQPSPRALALLERWHDATYAQLIDDTRVLACFDSDQRLVGYEFF